MIGDCDNCGHSIVYHVPLVGCVKCSYGDPYSCKEFKRATRGDGGAARRMEARLDRTSELIGRAEIAAVAWSAGRGEGGE